MQGEGPLERVQKKMEIRAKVKQSSKNFVVCCLYRRKKEGGHACARPWMLIDSDAVPRDTWASGDERSSTLYPWCTALAVGTNKTPELQAQQHTLCATTSVASLRAPRSSQARNTRPSYADLIGKLEPFVSADIFLPFALFYDVRFAQVDELRTTAGPQARHAIGLDPCRPCPLWVPLQRPSGRGGH